MNKLINDSDLIKWCVINYASDDVGECVNCPYNEQCDDFIKRHNKTPLFGDPIFNEV